MSATTEVTVTLSEAEVILLGQLVTEYVASEPDDPWIGEAHTLVALLERVWQTNFASKYTPQALAYINGEPFNT